MLIHLGLGSLPCKYDHSEQFETCLGIPPASRWSLSHTRRILDLSIAALVLLVFSIPMGIIAACVRLTSNGKALFSQKRVGRNGRLFRIYKFRSMVELRGDVTGVGLTKGGDQRVTPLGRWMRKFKLDELPQFYNVLRGDMSLVGPRPKLPQYAGISNMPYRPGITGSATIAFRSEEEILRHVAPQQINTFYAEHIKPKKAKLDVCYMCRATFYSDLRIVATTFLSCIVPAHIPSFLRPYAPSTNSRTTLAHEEPQKLSAGED
jgi:lipopolysaccharide/colanic/teichoic acid biosynthesis glycosyltransferase